MQSAVEDLPNELEGIASEVQVQFPWGSLLRGVAGGDEVVMQNIRRICLPNAQLQVTIGIDPLRDHFEWERLRLPAFSLDYIKIVLASRYTSAGFRIITAEKIASSDLSHLQTSWARRLHQNSTRSVFQIAAVAESQSQ